MPILGLMHSEAFASDRFKNMRRTVYYYYPNGASPLMGILSLLKEETTNDPEFKWFEKRLDEQRTLTVAISANNPLYVVGNPTWTATSADFTPVVGTEYGIKVASTSMFRVGHVIKFNVIVATVATEMQGRVTVVDTTNLRLSFIAITTPGANLTWNAAAGVSQEILVIGSAHAEGTLSSAAAPYNQPINPANYTQIFKTSFQITGTALKTSVRFDKAGIFPDQSEEASTYHMIEMEKAFLYGTSLQTQPGGAGTVAVRYTGGILWFLKQWEAANSIYRGGAGAPAITTNTDDAKRIINLTDGYLTHKIWATYLERVFRNTNNKANEKLVLCGSGFLSVINQMFEGRACFEVKPPSKDTYGMDITSYQSPFGTVHFKSHPLFTQNAVMRNNALFLDVNNLKYRNLEGRDTVLKQNTQPNDADYVQHEWLTEAGLELNQPESCMYLQNVQDFRA